MAKQLFRRGSVFNFPKLLLISKQNVQIWWIDKASFFTIANMITFTHLKPYIDKKSKYNISEDSPNSSFFYIVIDFVIYKIVWMGKKYCLKVKNCSNMHNVHERVNGVLLKFFANVDRKKNFLACKNSKNYQFSNYWNRVVSTYIRRPMN